MHEDGPKRIIVVKIKKSPSERGVLDFMFNLLVPRVLITYITHPGRCRVFNDGYAAGIK